MSTITKPQKLKPDQKNQTPNKLTIEATGKQLGQLKELALTVKSMPG